MGNKPGSAKNKRAKRSSRVIGGRKRKNVRNDSDPNVINMHRRLTHVRVGTTERKICIDDFDTLKVLGKGSFGKVLLVRRRIRTELRNEDASEERPAKEKPDRTPKRSAIFSKISIIHSSSNFTLAFKPRKSSTSSSISCQAGNSFLAQGAKALLGAPSQALRG